jgi:hypothetical protein
MILYIKKFFNFLLKNIYMFFNIFFIFYFLVNLSSNFFKFFNEVISIINKKNTLFKGFTRVPFWVPSLMKQNLNRTQKHK